jgi:hypothetical protein
VERFDAFVDPLSAGAGWPTVQVRRRGLWAPIAGPPRRSTLARGRHPDRLHGLVSRGPQSIT